MKLTRVQVIAEHRKMWRWIVEQYRKGRVEDPSELKKEYLERVGHAALNECYLCEYARQVSEKAEQQKKIYSSKCVYCPINFLDLDSTLKMKTDCNLDFIVLCIVECSPYRELYFYCSNTPAYFRNSKYMAELALEIANLSEREMSENDS